MKIVIGSDHGGFELKQKLNLYFMNKGLDLIDLGTDSLESCDYPDVADPVCYHVLDKKADLGILICGTGLGMSFAANRHKGIRAAILYSDFVAEMAKEHNNANIMVFGGRTMSYEEVIKRIEIFMDAKFEAGRHERRIEKLDK